MNIKDYVADNNLWRSSMQPLDSAYITWEKSTGGIRPNVNREAIIDGINASVSGSLQTAIPAKIISGTSIDGFTIELYADGTDKASTGSATGVMALDMAIADSACIGEYVYVFSNTITITGGE